MISVLCVDDDSTYLDIMKRYLEEPGALTITTALSATEALNVNETKRFDAVVEDYSMPVMDGIELLKAVRERTPSGKHGTRRKGTETNGRDGTHIRIASQDS